jgi:putative toxin-antitoxin system antitoxin component (TIGR02293 family)
VLPIGNPRLTKWLTLTYAEHMHTTPLSIPRGPTPDLIQHIERGFPFKSLESLSAASGLTVPAIAAVLGIPERTLARRRIAGRLNPDESERLLRVATVFTRAVDLFEGNVAAAVAWLTGPKKATGHRSPLAYSRTEVGAREVENLIGRLEHGVFS